MKNKIYLKFFSIILFIAALVTAACAVMVTSLEGAGSIERADCVGIAVICGILAIAAWIFSGRNSEK